MQRESRLLILGGLCALCCAAPAGAQVAGVPDAARPGSEPGCAQVANPGALPAATQGKPYSAVLWTRGGLAKLTAPAGLSGSGGNLTGTPTQAGNLTVTATVVSGPPCPNLAYVITRTWTISIADTQQPAIGAFTVAPTALSSMGGDVTVTIAASDNLGVAKVFSSRTLPDGTGNSGALQLASGTAQNGTWTMKWALPANGGTAPVSYVLKAWALDAAGNQVRAGSERTVVVARKATAQEILKPNP